MRSIFLIVCMCCSLITLAQSNFKVSGIVIGVDKEPIIGATIQDKSNQTGVITDVEGRFTINASSRNAVLRVGYIGMKSEEIKVEVAFGTICRWRKETIENTCAATW